MNYQGTVFGDLLVPYFELHENLENPYTQDDVVCRPSFWKDGASEKVFEIPDLEVRKLKDRLVEQKKEDAKLNKRVFFDGSLVRLKEYSLNDEIHKLYLELQRTSFFTFSATNKSLDNPEVRRMINERGASYTNLDDGLANPIGVNIVLISKPDNAIILTKRSGKLSQYPELYGIPAGFMSAEKDRKYFKEQDAPVTGSEFGPITYTEKFVYNPFLTAKREVTEEAANNITIDSIKMMGNGKAVDDRHNEFQMIAETPSTVEKILSAPKSSKWETEKLFGVPFNPKNAMEYLTKTIKEEPKGVPKGTGAWVPGKSPEWVPAHWKAVHSALIQKFGFDEVWNAYEETRRNH